MVPHSMTLTDPNPGFKVTTFSEVEYLKNLRTKLLYHCISKPYLTYRIFGDFD